MKKNYIAYVLDTSGSMGHLESHVRKLADRLVRTASEESLSRGMDTRVSLFTFSDYVRRLVFNSDPSRTTPGSLYRVDGGMTALRDGVGEAIRAMRQMPDADDPDVSFLIITLTDGGENNSSRFTRGDIQSLMRDVQSTGRWSITFQVPPGGRESIEREFGIPLYSENIREWEATVDGIERATRAAQVGTQSYFSARSLGAKSVDNFYVTTDLSKVTDKDIKKNLDDISHQFRSYSVAKETEIKTFAEYHTGQPYVIGSAYYTLSKPEKVQPQKNVLIMEKGKKTVWGGDQARKLIGLPNDRTCKVTPGNHSNYDIYVQSTSVNRKLPRGTKVLIDRTHTQNSTPTWDHTQVGRSK